MDVSGPKLVLKVEARVNLQTGFRESCFNALLIFGSRKSIPTQSVWDAQNDFHCDAR